MSSMVFLSSGWRLPWLLGLLDVGIASLRSRFGFDSCTMIFLARAGIRPSGEAVGLFLLHLQQHAQSKICCQYGSCADSQINGTGYIALAKGKLL